MAKPDPTSKPRSADRRKGGCARTIVVGALLLVFLLCLGAVGLGGAGVAVWALWPDLVASTPDGDADLTGPPPARVPWANELRADALELATGTSTGVTLDLRDTGPGAADWEVDWRSSCGAVAPRGDGTSARFFAPNKPGWCEVRAVLRVRGVPATTHTLDLLALDPVGGQALEVP